MNILSIQSWVAYGHVGNAAALFPLQRLGAEVWAVNTVQFSNHPGYGDHEGQVFEASAIAALVEGIGRRGALDRTDAVLSGYLGDAATGHAVLDAVARVRAVRPDALYCCDPVMGDAGPGLYVRPGVAALLDRESVPAADILTPNRFELDRLTAGGSEGGTLASVAARAHALRRRMRAGGPRLVLVTSVAAEETPADAIDLLLAFDHGTALLRTPALDLSANGAGDLIAALFLFHLLHRRDPVAALERATASVWGVLRRTVADGARELSLVQAQDELVAPLRRFGAVMLPDAGAGRG